MAESQRKLIAAIEPGNLSEMSDDEIDAFAEELFNKISASLNKEADHGG